MGKMTKKFTEEEKKRAKTQTKKCLTSLVIGEM